MNYETTFTTMQMKKFNSVVQAYDWANSHINDSYRLKVVYHDFFYQKLFIIRVTDPKRFEVVGYVKMSLDEMDIPFI